MALNYSFTGEWNAATKIIVGNWVKQKLTVVQDGEAPEDLFLEYIIVMIGNGKRMQELSHELQDFIGEDKANIFANDLGFFLQSLPNPEVVPPPAIAAVALTTTPAVTLIAAKKDILEGGLQSSRTIGSATQKPMRLLENAIRSTTSNSVKRKVASDRVVAGNTGLVTQSAHLSSTGSASSGGLFTKRGSAKLNNAVMTSTSEEDETSKKRRVIFDAKSDVKGFRTQSQFRGNEVPRNDYFIGMGNAEGNVMNMNMNMGQYPGPDNMGQNIHGNMNFPNMDPAFMYIEQMNMMAHRSGFASVEEMMFFQQNMMASMMSGGMPMPMHPPMSMHHEGPHMLAPPAESYAQHQARIQQQRGRGGRLGGRGLAGRGRGRSTERATPPSLDGASSLQPPVRAPAAPQGLPPVPPNAVPTAVQPPAVVAAVPNTPLAETESTPDSSFGYSGRGFANRGRGRGFRGGYQGGEGRGLFGAEGAPFEGGGGRFAYAAARGRGAYRGRGRGAVEGGVAASAPQAAGPVSFNKVWVRQADIETPLVAGR